MPYTNARKPTYVFNNPINTLYLFAHLPIATIEIVPMFLLLVTFHMSHYNGTPSDPITS
jgi:hypothetical protein